MKKLIFILCAILALSSVAALAEEISGKVVLWEHVSKESDENGNQIEVPVKVYIDVATPVTMKYLEVVDASDMVLVQFSREGVAPVVFSAVPAEIGAHANLNKATDEELQLYIDMVAEGFEEGKYYTEILKSESGNTYLVVGDDVIRSMWTIFEDFVMEVVQHSEDFTTPITEADAQFALEIGQAIWTE